MKPSEATPQTLTLDKARILDAVSKRSAYLSAKHDSPTIEAFSPDNQLLADYWQQACLTAVSACTPYVEKYSAVTDPVASCERSENFELTLRLPIHFDKTVLSSIEAALNEYTILHILCEWLQTCGAHELRESLQKDRDQQLLQLAEPLNMRQPPKRSYVAEDTGTLKYQ